VTDDQLRAAFQALSRDAEFTPACPPAGRLWAGAHGELPPAEVEALAAHLADCGACAEAWRVASDFGPRAELTAPQARLPWWLAAAAASVIAAGTSVWVLNRAPEPTPPPMVTMPPSFAIEVAKAPIRVSSRYALTFRGANDGRAFMTELKTALEPYERGDYAAAVLSLRSLVEKYPDLPEPSYYLGVSELMTGNVIAAIERLAQARDLADPDQHDDVTWYLAAAYERAGRRGEAQRWAQAVCDANGTRSAAACAAAAALGRPR
jgi:tetratricopeptide (TPR) repeat protein